MLSAFQLEDNRLTRLEADEIEHLASSVWVDLVEPNDEKRDRVQKDLGQNLAMRPELKDIKTSVRFFEDEGGLYIHSFFLYENADDHAGNSTVVFTIRESRLFTLRECKLSAFRLYRIRARNQVIMDGSAHGLLFDLFKTKIGQLVDEIEDIYSDLEKLSCMTMEERQGDKYDEALLILAEPEDIGWRVCLCLMDTQRVLDFLVHKARLPDSQLEQARETLRDIESLLSHDESLFQKVSFLMQAAMGFINVRQNRIIKIFPVVSVVFLPSMLAVFSYGMSFEFMPELHWSSGYPGAIVLMMLAGLALHLYFKRRNRPQSLYFTRPATMCFCRPGKRSVTQHSPSPDEPVAAYKSHPSRKSSAPPR